MVDTTHALVLFAIGAVFVTLTIATGVLMAVRAGNAPDRPAPPPGPAVGSGEPPPRPLSSR